eukprot:TRINITY_DN75261_c0_g1_i1.p1 TRINITY_DN75261_c0_g1~~TRINITY_DN75261_c0_g1_i1.p1  ORF type:complete len:139 (-),score=0.72 TRINITY_DN75261_c0_g1_i1:154-570(-)
MGFILYWVVNGSSCQFTVHWRGMHRCDCCTFVPACVRTPYEHCSSGVVYRSRDTEMNGKPAGCHPTLRNDIGPPQTRNTTRHAIITAWDTDMNVCRHEMLRATGSRGCVLMLLDSSQYAPIFTLRSRYGVPPPRDEKA